MMKKLILLIILVMFIPSVCFSGNLHYQFLKILKSRVSAACTASTPASPGNDEVGNVTEEATIKTVTKGSSWCYLATADCSGTLAIGYIWHRHADDTTAKIAIYSDDGDSIPNIGDLLIGVSGSINSTAAEWATDSSTIGGSVTQGSSYWVCIFSDPGSVNNWGTRRASATTTYNKNGSGHYASPPANLDVGGGWATNANEGDLSMFVGIE